MDFGVRSPESRNSLFRDSGDCFEAISDTFSTPGLPRETVSETFWGCGPEETPVRGGRVCNFKSLSPQIP